MCEDKKAFGNEEKFTQITAAIDPVQKKQIIVVEVYGDPLDFDAFAAALEAGGNEEKSNG